jgi:hypothetical protein
MCTPKPDPVLRSLPKRKEFEIPVKSEFSLALHFLQIKLPDYLRKEQSDDGYCDCATRAAPQPLTERLCRF